MLVSVLVRLGSPMCAVAALLIAPWVAAMHAAAVSVASTHRGDILCGLLMALVTRPYRETMPNAPDFKVM